MIILKVNLKLMYRVYKFKYPYVVQLIFCGFGDSIHTFTIAHKIAKNN